jgi:hypothetical protein
MYFWKSLLIKGGLEYAFNWTTIQTIQDSLYLQVSWWQNETIQCILVKG